MLALLAYTTGAIFGALPFVAAYISHRRNPHHFDHC